MLTEIKTKDKTYLTDIEVLKVQLETKPESVIVYEDFPAIRTGLRGAIIEFNNVKIIRWHKYKGISMNRWIIYLDNCCYNRPYDDQTSESIRLESEAKLFIQDCIKRNIFDLAWSFILDFENSANPFDERRDSIGSY